MEHLFEQYAEAHSIQESNEASAIREFTNATLDLPHMLSGGLQGALLQMLVKSINANRILELGTYSGYSAYYFLHNTNCNLITIEKQDEIASHAKRHLATFIQAGRCEVKVGDCKEILENELNNAQFDFVFIDANKGAYDWYYEWALSHVPSGGHVILDNMLWKGEVLDPKTTRAQKLANLNMKIATDKRVECVFLPIRDGLMWARKK